MASAVDFKVGDRVIVQWERGDAFPATILASSASNGPRETSETPNGNPEDPMIHTKGVLYEVEYEDKVKGKTCRETHVEGTRLMHLHTDESSSTPLDTENSTSAPSILSVLLLSTYTSDDAQVTTPFVFVMS